MSFPEKIYLFEEYIVFLKYMRNHYPNIKTLFFIDKMSPLIMSLINQAYPDVILNKREKIILVSEICRSLLQQEKPLLKNSKWRRQATTITPGEKLVLCEIARQHSIQSIAQRLHMNPRTIYSHLNNVGKKFGTRNRVELLKMIAMI